MAVCCLSLPFYLISLLSLLASNFLRSFVLLIFRSCLCRFGFLFSSFRFGLIIIPRLAFEYSPFARPSFACASVVSFFFPFSFLSVKFHSSSCFSSCFFLLFLFSFSFRFRFFRLSVNTTSSADVATVPVGRPVF